MMKRRFIQCDVFSGEALRGNGLAVVLDGQGLNADQMQAFAAWTQQAETTFLIPPNDASADYGVRIFSPNGEMRFAGHPTLGSCAAWLHSGGQPNNASCVVQECAIGLVEIDQSGAVPAFVAPRTAEHEMDAAERSRICAALGIAADDVQASVTLDNGVRRHVLELPSAQAVLSIDPRSVSKPAFTGVSLLGKYPTNDSLDYEVRNLTPASDMAEDPVTGSLIAAVGVWLAQHGRLGDGAVISQGTAMGRVGRAYVTPRADKIMIGGQCRIVIQGSVQI
jgi:PhzF family phenazine biosynthesis protein